MEEELADIMIYLLSFANKTGIDIPTAVEQKLEKNNKKYPARAMKGKHSNFLEGVKGSLLNEDDVKALRQAEEDLKNSKTKRL